MAHKTVVLDGFNRVKNDSMRAKNYNREEQPMQGYNRIMQGYKKGTDEDLKDWEFLVNIEHPSVMQGFENFLSQANDPMNGKRRDERRAERQEKKNEKASNKQARTGIRDERKQKRRDRVTAGQDRKERRKEARTAKKEERVINKMSKRQEREKDKEARRLRKQKRIDDRAVNRADRRDTRTERGGRWADAFERIGIGVGGPLLDNLVTGGGVFSDGTFSDIPINSLPGDFEAFVDMMQDMSPEEALRTRDMIEEEGSPLDVEGNPGKPPGPAGDGSKKSSMMPLVLLVGGGLLLASKPKNKRK